MCLALGDFADDDGRTIFPSVAYVAWKTGYTRRQVQRHMDELRRMGLLVLVAEPGVLHPTAEYRLDVSAASLKPAFERPPSRRHGWTPQDHMAGEQEGV